MKHSINAFICFGLASVVACSPTGKSADTPANQISSFKLDGSSALFRSSDDADTTTSYNKASSEAGRMNKLFNLLDSGEYTKQKYIDGDGIERDLEASIIKIKWLSKKYVFISLSNGFEALINLKNGAIVRVESLDIDSSSLALFSNYVFAFTKDLKSLKRINLVTKETVLYVTLPEQFQFISSGGFLSSTVSLWWQDDDSVSYESKSFETMMIDGDLNVAVQVIDSTTPGNIHYPNLAISPNGDFAKIQFFEFGSPTPKTLTYYNNKLYSVLSKSGPYVHMWPQSPTPQDVDFTLSEVHITQNGVVHQQLEQIKPFTSPLSYSSSDVLCRSSYTVDSEKRYVVTVQGVLTIDLSATTNSRLNFKQINWAIGDTYQSLIWYSKPSNSCYISGEYVYFLKDEQIHRLKLNNLEPLQYELLSQQNGIKAFYVVGKHIFFSTEFHTFRIKLDGSNQTIMPGSFNINDIIPLN